MNGTHFVGYPTLPDFLHGIGRHGITVVHVQKLVTPGRSGDPVSSTSVSVSSTSVSVSVQAEARGVVHYCNMTLGTYQTCYGQPFGDHDTQKAKQLMERATRLQERVRAEMRESGLSVLAGTFAYPQDYIFMRASVPDTGDDDASPRGD